MTPTEANARSRPARAAVSRADLALLLALDDRLAEAAAPLLGFEAPLPVVEHGQGTVEHADAAAPVRPEPPPAKAGSMPFWRLAAVTFAEAEGPAPPPTPAAPPPEPEGELFTGRPSAPVVPWSRLEVRLQRHLGAEAPSRRVDAPVLSRALARARPVRRIPLKSMRIWPRRLHLWVDWSPRLLPLWPDALRLAMDLLRRCGAEALCVQAVQPGESPPAGRVQPGDGVLVVSDFGALSGGAGRWQVAARALRRRGIQPRALAPGAGSVEGYEVLPWEASARRADGAAVQRLLDRLSSIELAQPALLRDVRRLDPGVGVMAELRAWNHAAFAAADAAGLVMRPDERERRRERFADDPAGAEVAALVAEHREGQPSDLLARDHLLWPGAEGPGDAALALRYLERLEALQVGGDPSWRALVERHAVAGIPAARLEDELLGPVLQRVIARVCAGRSGVPVPETLDMQAVRDTEPAPADVTFWAVRQVGGHLHFSPATTPIWPSAATGPGSPVAVLPARRALLWATAGGRTQYLLGEAVVPLPAGDTLILQTDAATLTLRRDRPNWAAAVGRDRYGLWADLEVEGVLQRLRWIPPGRFRMGSPDGEAGRNSDEGPAHDVLIASGYWLGDTPVTQALWNGVLKENSNIFRQIPRPVERITWHDAERFVQAVAARGCPATLPTEAQWEHACRAGTTTATWLGGDEAERTRIAWYDVNSGGETRPVGQLRANPWGLYDMLGNVWEWCADAPRRYAGGEPHAASDRVYRGGSWDSHARRVRAAFRAWFDPNRRALDLGLRLAVQSAERPGVSEGPHAAGGQRPDRAGGQGAGAPGGAEHRRVRRN